MANVFGLLGFVFALLAYLRVGKLEKKLKEFDVIPAEFDSSDGMGLD